MNYSAIPSGPPLPPPRAVAQGDRSPLPARRRCSRPRRSCCRSPAAGNRPFHQFGFSLGHPRLWAQPRPPRASSVWAPGLRCLRRTPFRDRAVLPSSQAWHLRQRFWRDSPCGVDEQNFPARRPSSNVNAAAKFACRPGSELLLRFKRLGCAAASRSIRGSVTFFEDAHSAIVRLNKLI